MSKKPTTDDLFAAIEWLDAYEGDNDGTDSMYTALRTVANSLAEQAAKNIAAEWQREFVKDLKKDGKRLTSEGVVAARELHMRHATDAVNKALAPLQRINVQI